MKKLNATRTKKRKVPAVTSAKTSPSNFQLGRFSQDKSKLNKKMVISVFMIIAAGILSGYLLFRFSSAASSGGLSADSSGEDAKLVVGSKDTKTFSDSAEGELQEGGLNGEGTHKLIRPGGESQTVYLTSSVLDLDEFVGKKVRVWGETFAAQKAAWLMDVGRVELLE